jgi:hypothetical protein
MRCRDNDKIVKLLAFYHKEGGDIEKIQEEFLLNFNFRKEKKSEEMVSHKSSKSSNSVIINLVEQSYDAISICSSKNELEN